MEDVCEVPNELRRIISLNRFVEGMNVCTSREKLPFTGDNQGSNARVTQSIIDGSSDNRH